jgi:hypothetical protein
MTVKIYLRAIKQGKVNSLAMFDSNGQGGINDLTTDAYPGDTVIWKLDCCSGIKSITKIYPKENDPGAFKVNATPQTLCKGFKFQLEKGVKGTANYCIKCILCENTEMIIDPYIRVPPPRI